MRFEPFPVATAVTPKAASLNPPRNVINLRFVAARFGLTGCQPSQIEVPGRVWNAAKRSGPSQMGAFHTGKVSRAGKWRVRNEPVTVGTRCDNFQVQLPGNESLEIVDSNLLSNAWSLD